MPIKVCKSIIYATSVLSQKEVLNVYNSVPRPPCIYARVHTQVVLLPENIRPPGAPVPPGVPGGFMSKFQVTKQYLLL